MPTIDHCYCTHPDESSKPGASAFGYDIGDTQKELFGDKEESSSDGEWAGHEEEEEDHHDNEYVNERKCIIIVYDYFLISAHHIL